MKKVSASDYKEYISWAMMNSCNRVYPLSIAEGYQDGSIYVNEGYTVESVLFWHYCGFAYISGVVSDAFLEDLYAEMKLKGRERRLVLITDDPGAMRYFGGKKVQMDARVEYCYVPNKKRNVKVDEGQFRIEAIDEGNVSRIEGKIVPAFSWRSSEEFLRKGFGYVALDGDRVCAVAFSAAVSMEEVDIGVETCEAYRGKGLAAALTDKMCEHILEMGKLPVWAHAAANKGSMHTALKCGFVEEKRNIIIRKE